MYFDGTIAEGSLAKSNDIWFDVKNIDVDLNNINGLSHYFFSQICKVLDKFRRR